MALPIITVIAATGAQGKSVVDTLIKNANPRYQIRALTSNTSSHTARELNNHPCVSVLHVDVNSIDSLVTVFQGSIAIFANTIFDPTTFLKKGSLAARDLEEQHGLNIVQAASRISSLQHLIWSTLPDGKKITNGRFDIPHLQSKIAVEKYIQDESNGLANKSTFLRIGMYGTNLSRPPYRPLFQVCISAPCHFDRILTNFLKPVTKKHIMMLPCSPTVRFPFIGDETVNIGVIVDAILQQPQKTIGRYVLGASENICCRDWASSLTKTIRKDIERSGEDVVFVQCELSEFEQIWGETGTEIGTMMEYFSEFGEDSLTIDTGSVPILRPADLGISGELRTTEDRLLSMDW